MNIINSLHNFSLLVRKGMASFGKHESNVYFCLTELQLYYSLFLLLLYPFFVLTHPDNYVHFKPHEDGGVQI